MEETGMTLDFSGVTIPFTAGEILTAAVQLMTVLGPFVLLGLAIFFTPKLIQLVKQAAS